MNRNKLFVFTPHTVSKQCHIILAGTGDGDGLENKYTVNTEQTSMVVGVNCFDFAVVRLKG